MIQNKDMDKFPLGHTVLYFKGWYKKSYNIYEDLRKILYADGYAANHFTDADCLICILRNIDSCRDIIRQRADTGLGGFYEHVQKMRYHNEHVGSVEQGLFSYIKSILGVLNVSDFKDVRPDYSILPKPFVKTADDLAESMSYSFYDKPWECGQDLRQFIINECNQTIDWVGDFKDPEDVADHVLPILKEILKKKYPMNCNNCVKFKQQFGRNIRVANPIEYCSGQQPDGCLIQKIADEADANAKNFADAVPYSDPNYVSRIKEFTINAALEMNDLDSYTNQIAEEHDAWLEEAAKAIDLGVSEECPF